VWCYQGLLHQKAQRGVHFNRWSWISHQLRASQGCIAVLGSAEAVTDERSLETLGKSAKFEEWTYNEWGKDDEAAWVADERDTRRSCKWNQIAAEDERVRQGGMGSANHQERKGMWGQSQTDCWKYGARAGRDESGIWVKTRKWKIEISGYAGKSAWWGNGKKRGANWSKITDWDAQCGDVIDSRWCLCLAQTANWQFYLLITWRWKKSTMWINRADETRECPADRDNLNLEKRVKIRIANKRSRACQASWLCQARSTQEVPFWVDVSMQLCDGVEAASQWWVTSEAERGKADASIASVGKVLAWRGTSEVAQEIRIRKREYQKVIWVWDGAKRKETEKGVGISFESDKCLWEH